MKYLTLLVTLPVTVIVVVFAVNNRDGVALNPWPLDGDITVPVFVVALAPFVVGFALGGIVQWLNGVGRRRRKSAGAAPPASGRAVTVTPDDVGADAVRSGG